MAYPESDMRQSKQGTLTFTTTIKYPWYIRVNKRPMEQSKFL